MAGQRGEQHCSGRVNYHKHRVAANNNFFSLHKILWMSFYHSYRRISKFYSFHFCIQRPAVLGFVCVSVYYKANTTLALEETINWRETKQNCRQYPFKREKKKYYEIHEMNSSVVRSSPAVTLFNDFCFYPSHWKWIKHSWMTRRKKKKTLRWESKEAREVKEETKMNIIAIHSCVYL